MKITGRANFEALKSVYTNIIILLGVGDKIR